MWASRACINKCSLNAGHSDTQLHFVCYSLVILCTVVMVMFCRMPALSGSVSGASSRDEHIPRERLNCHQRGR